MIDGTPSLNEMFIAKDEMGYLYAYGNTNIVFEMRRNSFRKIEVLKKELKRAYQLYMKDLYEDLENL